MKRIFLALVLLVGCSQPPSKDMKKACVDFCKASTDDRRNCKPTDLTDDFTMYGSKTSCDCACHNPEGSFNIRSEASNEEDK